MSDPVGQNPLCIKSLDWSAEGYQMWIVNSKTRSEKATDPDFMPYPEEFEKDTTKKADSMSIWHRKSSIKEPETKKYIC